MKRYKYIAIVFIVVLAICTGCGNEKTEYGDRSNAPKTMTVVDCTNSYTIYRHDETGVHYFCRDGVYGRSVCVMVNEDGAPYTGKSEG